MISASPRMAAPRFPLSRIREQPKRGASQFAELLLHGRNTRRAPSLGAPVGLHRRTLGREPRPPAKGPPSSFRPHQKPAPLLILTINCSKLDSLSRRMLVCHCKRVCDRTIRQCVIDGARTVDQVGAACRAGTGGGGCRPLVEALIQLEVRRESGAGSASSDHCAAQL